LSILYTKMPLLVQQGLDALPSRPMREYSRLLCLVFVLADIAIGSVAETLNADSVDFLVELRLHGTIEAWQNRPIEGEHPTSTGMPPSFDFVDFLVELRYCCGLGLRITLVLAGAARSSADDRSRALRPQAENPWRSHAEEGALRKILYLIPLTGLLALFAPTTEPEGSDDLGPDQEAGC
jgi:hypothetical protein